MRAPPPDTGFGFCKTGAILNWCLLVAPHHPLVHEEEPLSRQTIKRFRAIVVGDSVHSSRSIGSELLDAQEAITVFDFKTQAGAAN
ncbi:transcriptional regulator [Salmonella enterica subsp. enterica]|uniref:Transcriptional regulator n=1 Tax=Salmonella enterica I TaxID=59201 RepID=A0A447N859_SALET|nr:transcriptional regulator [Salmonella enterica subsp. enterica]